MATAGNVPGYDVDIEGQPQNAEKNAKHTTCPRLVSSHRASQSSGVSSYPCVPNQNDLDKPSETQQSLKQQSGVFTRSEKSDKPSQISKPEIKGANDTAGVSDFKFENDPNSHIDEASYETMRRERPDLSNEDYPIVRQKPQKIRGILKNLNEEKRPDFLMPRDVESEVRLLKSYCHRIEPNDPTTPCYSPPFNRANWQNVCESAWTVSPSSPDSSNAALIGCLPRQTSVDIDPSGNPPNLTEISHGCSDRFPKTLSAANLEKDLDRSLAQILRRIKDRRSNGDQRSSFHKICWPPGRYLIPNNAPAVFPHNTTAAFCLPHQGPLPQIHQNPGHMLAPPPSYEECMKVTSSQPLTSSRQVTSQPLVPDSQTGQGEGEVISRQPPAYRTTVPISFRQCPLFSSDNYTRFIDDSTEVDRWQRRAQGHERYKRFGDNCPCMVRVDADSNDHMILSMLACLMCWPIGLGAVYYSYMCRRYKRIGNHEKSASYANSALATGMTGVLLGLVSFFAVYVNKRRYF